MKTKNPDSRLSFRLLGITIGLIVFLWLSFEDKSETKAIILAIAINSWIAIRYAKQKQKQTQFKIINFVILGLLVGATLAPVTLILMAFKTGLHSHLIPEYTKIQVISIIRRVPLWMIGSIFISLGLGILNSNSQNLKDSVNATEF